jgi:hypothetical protein
MLLFFTREAFFKFSIEDRLDGTGDSSGSKGLRFSMLARLGEVGSRTCQKSLGELAELGANGDESYGDESPLKLLVWLRSVKCRSIGSA